MFKGQWALARAALMAVFVGMAAYSLQASKAQPNPAPAQAADFNYYILALTWTPGFCATHPGAEECGRGAGFGLHGLWPQVSAQDYPSFCSTEPLPRSVRAQYRDLYPNASLMDHEWTKHGTCSGLRPSDYFALSDQLRRKIVIPSAYAQPRDIPASEAGDLKQAFQRANPGLTPDGLKIKTADRMLQEVRICLTKDGDFRSCR